MYGELTWWEILISDLESANGSHPSSAVDIDAEMLLTSPSVIVYQRGEL